MKDRAYKCVAPDLWFTGVDQSAMRVADHFWTLMPRNFNLPLMNNCLYINLDKRPDRRAHIEKELAIYGFNPIRIAGIKDTPPLGCHASHIAALQYALDHSWTSVVVFEDDFKFCITPLEFQRIVNRLQEIPIDAFMLAHSILAADSCNYPGFFKILKATNGAGYYLDNYALLAETHSLFIAGLNLLRHEKKSSYINDVIWFSLMAKYKWYGSFTDIGGQLNDDSDNQWKEATSPST